MKIKIKISILLIILCLSSNSFAQLLVESEKNENLIAATWSVMLPGGGHFYKQNYSDGMFFLVSETLSGFGALLLTAEYKRGTDGPNSGAIVAYVLGAVSLGFFIPLKLADIASAAGCVEALPVEVASELNIYPTYNSKTNSTGLTISYNF